MNDKPETKIGYISPLKRICMTIGELPTSYLETMSYYEMLVWFVEFLKNQVIPVVNNNSGATEELQNLFVELQNYVNNYFDNLDVQEEINNKLDEMVESGELEDIIASYLKSVNSIYIAALTKPHDTSSEQDAYIGISYDGLCFNPIPETKNFTTNKDSDIQIFKYNDYYLFSCTTSANAENPNIDAYVGWTKDFETYHFESVSLGFSQYRNTNFSEASSDYRRWTPRFYLDEDNNLNMLISMATDNTLEYDFYEYQQRTQMKIFHQTVTFTESNSNFLTGNGDIDYFKINEDSQEVTTFFDGEMLYHNNVFYLFYKNGYYNDVNLAISTTNDYSTFNNTNKNIFGLPYTEAPCIIECNDGWYLYGQHYRLTNLLDKGRNLCIYTKDLQNFLPVGYPRRPHYNITTDGIIRNLSPCLITDKALVTSLRSKIYNIQYGGYNSESEEIKIRYNWSQYIVKCLKDVASTGRVMSILPNSWLRVEAGVNGVVINNFWKCNKFYVYSSSTNKNPFEVQFSYNNITERVIMLGNYPTSNFSFTENFIRNDNRSYVPSTVKAITGTSDKSNMAVETVITPNSLFAKVHLYNSNATNVWEANASICNIGIKNYQNNYTIYGTCTSVGDASYPVNSVFALYVDTDGNVKSQVATPSCNWRCDFIILMPTNFYNTFTN